MANVDSAHEAATISTLQGVMSAWLRSRQVPEPARDAELLLRAALGRDQAFIIAHPREPVAEDVRAHALELARRRADIGHARLHSIEVDLSDRAATAQAAAEVASRWPVTTVVHNAGVIRAALLPQVMDANRAALARRLPQSPVLARYDEVARLLTGRDVAPAGDGVEWVRVLSRTLAVPALASYGVAAGDIPGLVEKARAASSTKANPIALTREDMAEILARSL